MKFEKAIPVKPSSDLKAVLSTGVANDGKWLNSNTIHLVKCLAYGQRNAVRLVSNL